MTATNEELDKEALKQKSAEESVDTRGDELISIFDSIDEAIYICDPESHELLYVNAATEAIFGPDIVGKKCYRVFQGLESPCEFCTNPRIFGENLGNSYIWEFQNKVNGRWYRCIDKAIRWPDGRMVRYEMGIDIHDLKQAELAVRESEERYRRLTMAVTDYIYSVRIEDGCPVETVHGPACVAVTGYSAEDFANDPYLWINMVHEDDRNAVKDQADEVIAGRKVKPLEHRIIRKDGALRWVSNTAVPNSDIQGTLRFYDGLIRDITERKQAEEALRESEANYRLLFSAESDAIIVVDADTMEIVDANAAATEFYGYKLEELLGRNATLLSAQPDESAAHIRQVASGEPSVPSPGPVQRLHRKKDGTTFPVEISSGVYVLKGRKMVCAMMRDISERKRMEESLQQSLNELEQRVKEQTVALVGANEVLKREMEERKQAELGLRESESRLRQEERRMELLKFANEVALKLMHELRNPLVTIGGFSRRLSSGDYPENKQKEYARVIFEGSMRLDKVLDEVLAHLRAASEET
jgi:PAS domain S-box-containing protein